MTTETTVFLLTIGLGFAHIVVMAEPNIPEYGFGRLLGAHDALPPTDNVFLHRAWRANDNSKEILPRALGAKILAGMPPPRPRPAPGRISAPALPI